MIIVGTNSFLLPGNFTRISKDPLLIIFNNFKPSELLPLRVVCKTFKVLTDKEFNPLILTLYQRSFGLAKTETGRLPKENALFFLSVQLARQNCINELFETVVCITDSHKKNKAIAKILYVLHINDALVMLHKKNVSTDLHAIKIQMLQLLLNKRRVSEAKLLVNTLDKKYQDSAWKDIVLFFIEVEKIEEAKTHLQFIGCRQQREYVQQDMYRLLLSKGFYREVKDALCNCSWEIFPSILLQETVVFLANNKKVEEALDLFGTHKSRCRAEDVCLALLQMGNVSAADRFYAHSMRERFLEISRQRKLKDKCLDLIQKNDLSGVYTHMQELTITCFRDDVFKHLVFFHLKIDSFEKAVVGPKKIQDTFAADEAWVHITEKLITTSATTSILLQYLKKIINFESKQQVVIRWFKQLKKNNQAQQAKEIIPQLPSSALKSIALATLLRKMS